MNENIDEDDKEFITQNYLIRSDTTEKKITRKLTIFEIEEKALKTFRLRTYKNMLQWVGIDWNFDIWQVFNETNHSVFIIGKYLFDKWNFYEILNTKENIVKSFFLQIEKGYKNNPYHNAVHAADVCHGFLYFILNSSIADTFSSQDFIVCIISALGHDISHPGVTNRFLMNNRDSLAIKYNDISVLENMHCFTIYSILQNPLYNIFFELDDED